MTTPDQTQAFDPLVFIEHQRDVNRRFHDTDDKSAEMLDACLTEQLKEIGLFRSYHGDIVDGEPTVNFDYIEPKAVRLIIDAFMTGKMPQPEGRGSFLFTEKTALGRQSALDSALERVKAKSPYDVTVDSDFFPDSGEVDG